MPVPTVYTETTLADFMKSQLKQVADLIGWLETPGEYQDAVDETLIAYGVDDIANATDIEKLRYIARREVWRSVMQSTAGNYRFGSDREQYYRNQVHEQAKTMYAIFSTDAARYEDEDDRYNVDFVTIVDPADPYLVYTRTGDDDA